MHAMPRKNAASHQFSGGAFLNINKVIIPFLIVMGCLLIVGCSDYQEQFTFTGTVEEKLVEDEMLVIRQKLEVKVFSNTDADIWDLDRMKFEIKEIDE